MEFVNDPVKSKRVFIAVLIISIVFFVGTGVLGYLYYKERKLVNEKQSAIIQKDQEIANLQLQLDEYTGSSESARESLKSQNDILKKSNKTLTDQVNDYKAKSAKALLYNEVLKYVNSIIEAHGGFDGWTDAEFQTGKTKAEATGDAAYISMINWAWYEKSVPPLTRALRFFKDTASAIENSLK